MFANPIQLRKGLVVFSALFLVVYAVAALGALVLSGETLLTQHLALTLYSIAAPVLVALWFLAIGLGLWPSITRSAGLPLLIVTFPGIFVSLLGLGFLLVIPVALWIRLIMVERRQAAHSG